MKIRAHITVENVLKGDCNGFIVFTNEDNLSKTIYWQCFLDEKVFDSNNLQNLLIRDSKNEIIYLRGSLSQEIISSLKGKQRLFMLIAINFISQEIREHPNFLNMSQELKIFLFGEPNKNKDKLLVATQEEYDMIFR